jgi:acetyltransferase-like isoleucine patch superfamily enzyme
VRWHVLRRFLPGIFAQAYYFLRCRAFVSHRAEMEMSPDARLGRGTVISSFTKVKVAGPLVTGRRAQIATNCFLEAGEGGITLGDDVLIGPGTVLVTTNYRYDRVGVPFPEQGTVSRGIRVGDRSWIGSNCVLTDGVTVGRDVIVTAGSVVSGTVPDGAIVQGNPAKVIFTRRAEGGPA